MLRPSSAAAFLYLIINIFLISSSIGMLFTRPVWLGIKILVFFLLWLSLRSLFQKLNLFGVMSVLVIVNMIIWCCIAIRGKVSPISRVSLVKLFHKLSTHTQAPAIASKKSEFFSSWNLWHVRCSSVCLYHRAVVPYYTASHHLISLKCAFLILCFVWLSSSLTASHATQRSIIVGIMGKINRNEHWIEILTSLETCRT